MSTELTDSIQARPPRNGTTDNEDAVQSGVTAASAGSLDIWAGYTAQADGSKLPLGKVLMEVEALTTDAYVRCSRTATAATTTSTGTVVRVGFPRVFLLDPTKDLFWDVIGGVGVLKWRRTGPICERNRI